jgi:alpha-mannosidase
LIHSPVLLNPNDSISQSFFSVDAPNVVLDTIKVAEESRGLEIVIRLYEAYGGRGIAHLTRYIFKIYNASTVPVLKARFCNVLEDDADELTMDSTGAFVIPYTPFKVISLKLEVKV